MPVVTGLEVFQRDKERVRLFLDEEYVMDLPAIEAARLSHGQSLTESEVAELSDAECCQRAFDQAIRFLSFRPRSVEEVRRHLVKKKVPESVLAVAIERLQQRDYLDDLEFARFWISNRDRFKPMGSRALRFELRQKGVDGEIVDDLLAEFDEAGTAYRAAQARMSRYRGNTRHVFRQKMSAMLRRRGFGEYAIKDAVLSMQAELEACDPDYFHGDDAD